MSSLKNIFLFLSLIPFIALATISSFNLNSKTKLRILTWTTPPLSIGTLVFLSSGFGFGISSTLISLINQGNNNIIKSRKYITNIDSKFETDYSSIKDRNFIQTEELEEENNLFYEESYIERDPRDPLPTITVPYRVVNNNNRKINNEENNYKSIEKDTDLNFNHRGIKFDSEEFSNKSDWGNLITEDW